MFKGDPQHAVLRWGRRIEERFARLPPPSSVGPTVAKGLATFARDGVEPPSWMKIVHFVFDFVFDCFRQPSTISNLSIFLKKCIAPGVSDNSRGKLWDII